MGTYINIGNAGFQRARNSEYVDKSGLISALRNGLFNITSRDDVLTALIHFGFLNYDEQSGECYTTGREAAERLACYIGINYDRETKQHTCHIERSSLFESV